MSTNLATYNLNATTVAARAAEVPDASFAGGMNEGGSSAPGVGINTGNIDPKLQDWSVLDQAEAARNPQNSQHLGGSGLAVADTATSTIKAVQGADINDTVSFIVALAQAAPGVGMGAANADPINRTDVTVEIGDRVWGTNTVA